MGAGGTTNRHYDYDFKEGGGQARPKTVMQKGITVGGGAAAAAYECKRNGLKDKHLLSTGFCQRQIHNEKK